MNSKSEVRWQALPPFGILAVAAVVSVALAMTVLGNTPLPTSSPSPSPSPSPTAHVYHAPTEAPTAPPTPVPTVPLPSSLPVILTGYTAASDPNGIWFATWRYPRIREGSTPMAVAINKDILDQITTRLDQWEAGPASVRQAHGKVNHLTGSYGINLNANDLISITLRWVDDTIPGHVATNILIVNYSLASGQGLLLTDLFPDLQAALATISTQSRALLPAVLGAKADLTGLQAGTAPDLANFSQWALTTGGLRVVFRPGQLGTTIAGTPSVIVPWSALIPAMDPTSPVWRLATAGYSVGSPVPSSAARPGPTSTAVPTAGS
jgi:hypothetical protein